MPQEDFSLKDAITLFMDRQEYERRHTELREEMRTLREKVEALDKEIAANKDQYTQLYTAGTAWANQQFQQIRQEFLNEIKAMHREITQKLESNRRDDGKDRMTRFGWLIALASPIIAIVVSHFWH